MEYDIRKLTDYLWELPQTGGMRVPARIYARLGQPVGCITLLLDAGMIIHCVRDGYLRLTA